MTDPYPRPSFAREPFADAGLEELVAAFSRGNFALVRAKGAKIAADAGASDEVRRVATDLVQRTEPDPWSKLLLLFAAVLLLVVSGYWIAKSDTRAHAPRVPDSAQKPSAH